VDLSRIILTALIFAFPAAVGIWLVWSLVRRPREPR
jgi:uncharacterized membrane protein